MSFKETNSALSGGKRINYAEDGMIGNEIYNEPVKTYGADSDTSKKDERGLKNAIIKVLRNVLSILIGLITYIITEFLLTYVFVLLLKIPILSFLMTGHIPSNIFLNASVATGAASATFYIIKFISDYKSTNYSVIIVFSMLLILYVALLIYNVSTIGFNFSKLYSTLIFIGTFIFSCFMAKEEI